MTGREYIKQSCDTKSGEEMYDLFESILNFSYRYNDSRRAIIDWLDDPELFNNYLAMINLDTNGIKVISN